MTARVIYGRENPPGGSDVFQVAVAKARAARLYFEFDGGLGDVFVQATGSDTFIRLNDMAPGQQAVIVLFCHNPHAWELFGFHPKSDQITILALGFSDRREMHFRNRHGITFPPFYPEGIAPEKWTPYPSNDDVHWLGSLSPRKFAIFAVNASGGPNDNRSVPRKIIVDMVDACNSMGVVPVILGRRYPYMMKDDFVQGEPHVEPLDIPGAVSAVDRLTISGSIEALRRSVCNVVCDSSMMLASWRMRCPTYFMCAWALWEMFRKDGVIRAEGYRFGIAFPENENCVYEDYERKNFLSYLSKRLAP